MITKITKEQKKILYISGIVLIFFLFFWFSIYRPQTSKLVSIQAELVDAEAQIAEISKLTQGQDLAQAVKKLQIDFGELSGRLPKGEDEVISNLSEEALRLKIKVDSIDSSGGRPLDYQVAGYNIEELPISLNLVCEYRKLGEYLKTLREDFPVLIQIREISIEGSGEGNSDLNINLKILAFVSKGR